MPLGQIQVLLFYKQGRGGWREEKERKPTRMACFRLSQAVDYDNVIVLRLFLRGEEGNQPAQTQLENLFSVSLPITKYGAHPMAELWGSR